MVTLRIVVLISLAAVSIFFAWRLAVRSPKQHTPFDDLEYVWAIGSRAISTSPLDTDSLVNTTHMEQIVGTLIKQGAAGRLEPYLATAWQVSSDFRDWSFQLRPALTCEDGQTIDPHSFKNALERNLRMYAKDPVPVFQHLTGWQAFLKGKPLEGIRATAESITFAFDRPVRSGVLEFLQMPYYGFYCDRDYTKEGDWKDPRTITSSGAYALESIDADGVTIHLKKREGWFSLNPGAPERVRITQIPYGKAVAPSNRRRIIFGHPDGAKIPDDFVVVPSIPDMLTALVLSPKVSNLFQDAANRHVFHSRFRRAQAHLPKPDPDKIYGEYFYPAAKSKLPVIDHPQAFTKPFKKTVRVVVGHRPSDAFVQWIKSALTEVFADMDLELRIERLQQNDPHALQRLNANTEYDIRVATVSIGGNFDNWVIDMMFCSTLGISFPDPSGRICKLVREFDQNGLALDEYTRRFNSILHEDMAVVPLFHGRDSWLVPREIDHSLSPISAAPRFDLMRLKQ